VSLPPIIVAGTPPKVTDTAEAPPPKMLDPKIVTRVPPWPAEGVMEEIKPLAIYCQELRATT